MLIRDILDRLHGESDQSESEASLNQLDSNLNTDGLVDLLSGILETKSEPDEEVPDRTPEVSRETQEPPLPVITDVEGRANIKMEMLGMVEDSDPLGDVLDDPDYAIVPEELPAAPVQGPSVASDVAGPPRPGITETLSLLATPEDSATVTPQEPSPSTSTGMVTRLSRKRKAEEQASSTSQIEPPELHLRPVDWRAFSNCLLPTCSCHNAWTKHRRDLLVMNRKAIAYERTIRRVPYVEPFEYPQGFLPDLVLLNLDKMSKTFGLDSMWALKSNFEREAYIQELGWTVGLITVTIAGQATQIPNLPCLELIEALRHGLIRFGEQEGFIETWSPEESAFRRKLIALIHTHRFKHVPAFGDEPIYGWPSSWSCVCIDRVSRRIREVLRSGLARLNSYERWRYGGRQEERGILPPGKGQPLWNTPSERHFRWSNETLAEAKNTPALSWQEMGGTTIVRMPSPAPKPAPTPTPTMLEIPPLPPLVRMKPQPELVDKKTSETITIDDGAAYVITLE